MAKKILLNELELYLLPQRAVFIPKYALLLVSDWHLGKLSHFRKEGLFVPAPNPKEEFSRLVELIDQLKPKEVLFLGDLFHSSWNKDWEDIKEFLNSFSGRIQFKLTKGNHDILEAKHFENLNLIIREQFILSEGIVFSHEPIPGLADYLYNVVGHIHPGILLETKGRQSFRLPCFYLENQVLTIPAFGKYTGLHLLKKGRESQVFAIVQDTIVSL